MMFVILLCVVGYVLAAAIMYAVLYLTAQDEV